MRRAFGSTFFLLVLLLSAVWATPAMADTVGPSITNRSPANDTVITGSFTVRAHLSDADTIDPNVTVTVDGTAYPVSFTYGGHWEGDGCDSWWVEDKTIADISCSIPDLPPGNHTVIITARDALGNVSTDTFTVIRTSHLTFSDHFPAQSSRNKYVSLIEVKVTGPSIDASSVTMTVDGASVVATYAPTSDPTVGWIRFEGLVTDGTRSVKVTARDADGNEPASTQWSFLVDSNIEGPVASSIDPAEGAVVQGPFTLSLRATDADGVNGGASRLSVAGQLLSPSSVNYPYGHWEDDGCNAWWVTDYTRCDITFSVPDLAPGPHTMALTLVDDLTDSSFTQWSITRSSDLTIGSLQPADTARVGTAARVSAAISGSAEVDTSTVTMTLDGVFVPAVWDSASSTVYYDAVLTEGTHVITVSAADVHGNAPASRTWSFVSDVSAPVISSYEPTGTCTDALSGVRVVMTDIDGISPSSVTLQLDGSVYAMSTASAGTTTTATWSGTFTEGSHDATFTASDLAGNTTVHAWSFFVADPPRFGTPSPASGAWTPKDVVFKIPVKDVNAQLDTASLSAALDGQPVPAGIALTDGSTGEISVSLTGLSDGAHTLTVAVADAVGNIGSLDVPFNADAAGPVAQSPSPSPGSTLGNHNVHVSIVFQDDRSFDLSASRMWVDGQQVSSTSAFVTYWEGDGCSGYEVEDTTQMRVYTSLPLHDGDHDVRVQVKDGFGNLSEHSWSFTVHEYPWIASLKPVASSSTTDTAIDISATATDYDGIDPASVTVRWRRANTTAEPGPWNTLARSFDSTTGAVSSTFLVPWTETRYEIEVSVADMDGSPRTAMTDIYVGTTRPTMVAGTDCSTVCHPTILETHVMTDCATCHYGAVDGPCAGSSCHGDYGQNHSPTWMTGLEFQDHSGYYTGRTCTDCHSHAVKLESMRHWSSAPTECEPCHARALTTEHASRTDSSGTLLTCDSCHRSADTTVTAAIIARDTGCTACHGVSDAAHIGLHDTQDLDGPCTTCHDNNLSDEHLENVTTQAAPKRCDTCHESSSPIVTGSIASRSEQCFACHSVAHANRFAESLPASIPVYPDVSWSVPEKASLWKGAPWLTAEMAAEGRIVFSSRSASLDPAAVYAFYRDEMTAAGWQLVSDPPPAGADFFVLTFSGSGKTATVWFYGGADHDAAPLSPAGYRIEVMYR